MTPNKPRFVSFEFRDEHLIGFLSMNAALEDEGNPAGLLDQATRVYERFITKLRAALVVVRSARAEHKRIPAHEVWYIGQLIFELRNELGVLSLELDGVYDHLVRDLGVKRKWLEKVVTFRRYLPDNSVIPTFVNWGRCEKGTRRVALRLRNGLPLD